MFFEDISFSDCFASKDRQAALNILLFTATSTGQLLYIVQIRNSALNSIQIIQVVNGCINRKRSKRTRFLFLINERKCSSEVTSCDRCIPGFRSYVRVLFGEKQNEDFEH